MAPVPEKVLNWLYSVLPSEYLDANRTYSDVAETLSHYPSLSPRTEVYTYENGASALLLQLSGTLPVIFRGATYGFPIHLWVPHRYPQEAPMVYVVPSQDMLVRPGQHVSGDGRVYHPYLAQWGKYWDKSTIFDFLAVLRGVFTKEPPVRSKQQAQFNSANTASVPPPVPPTPEEWRRSMQGSPAPSPAPAQRPQPPPKPPKPYERPPNRPLQQPETQYDRTGPPSNATYAPQIPAKPYGRTDGWQQPAGQPQILPQRQSSYDTNPPTPLGRPLRPHIQSQGPQQPFQIASHELGSPVSPITPEGQPRNSTSQYQQPLLTQRVPTSHPYPPPSQQRGNYPQVQFQQPPLNMYPPSQRHQPMIPPISQLPLKPKQPILDLLDSPLDVTLPSQSGLSAPIPAPPIPPNPEKDALLTALSSTLVAQLRQNITDNTNAIAPLQAQQQALREAHSRLQSELDQLQQLDAALASNEHILRDAMVEADRVMEDARTRKVPDVDDVLVAPFVVGGQLYTLCAEERACADALFVLGRALDKGRVGADVFIKQTRSLAREQFLKKALIKKISKGMALDEYQMR
ncbi:UEV-domain-containing protein [Lophium mytilinum]|uniref:UEV-domain-containing protein n=1 Tax=Lophium mytilinum TaxID=390894 RepID=A0A6A6RFW0_9PEZI|nr:UEV-domain-containing protein [Lophium mytilinum]